MIVPVLLLLVAQTAFVPSTAEERYVLELREAVAKGDVEAEVTLANMYEAGSVVPQDVARAAALYRDAATKGHVGAQLNLATMYVDGHGLARDIRQAVMWYERAAAGGSALAAFSLGTLYENGAGRLRRDAATAASWYRRAAEQCFVSAQYRLGQLYADGRGVPRDARLAIEWLRRAADQGDADAQIALGVLLTPGRSATTHDIIEAYMWLNLAASRWKDEGKRVRSAALRDALEQTMTIDQRSAALRRATEWQDEHSRRPESTDARACVRPETPPK